MPLDNGDWERLGHHIPLLVDLQPAGRFLGEDFFRAGGVPAVVAELLAAGALPHPDAPTVNGRTIRENCEGRFTEDREVIRAYGAPMLPDAGFLNLSGNLFDSAIMKTSVISPTFRARYLSDPDDPDAFEGRAVVFDGREDYHARINDPSLAIDAHTHAGHPRRRPDRLSGRGGGGEHAAARCAPGERASTSCRASAMVASRVRPVRRRSSTRRRRRPWVVASRCCAPVIASASTCGNGPPTCSSRTPSCRLVGPSWRRSWPAEGLPYVPASQTPWQEIQRGMVDQLAEGMVLKPAVKYQDIAHGPRSVPRDNH